jgi:hypothetical protein
MSLSREELIDRVNDATSGNRHDYLTREDVAQIVNSTLEELGVPNHGIPEPDEEAAAAGPDVPPVPNGEPEGEA